MLPDTLSADPERIKGEMPSVVGPLGRIERAQRARDATRFRGVRHDSLAIEDGSDSH
jgi:hypothetical protein